MTNKNDKFKTLFDKIAKITQLDTKTLEQRALKTSEETGELAQAVLSFVNASGSKYKGLGKDDVIEESADVFLCAVAMVIHASLYSNEEPSFERFLNIIEAKMNKWESKVFSLKDTF